MKKAMRKSQPARQPGSLRPHTSMQAREQPLKQTNTHTDTHTQPPSIDTATEVTMCQQPRGRQESRMQVVQPCSGQMVWLVWAKLLAAVAAPAPSTRQRIRSKSSETSDGSGPPGATQVSGGSGPLVPVVARDPLAPVVARGLLAERRSAAQRSLLGFPFEKTQRRPNQNMAERAAPPHGLSARPVRRAHEQDQSSTCAPKEEGWQSLILAWHPCGNLACQLQHCSRDTVEGTCPSA